jgi:hypothetical protein
MTKAKGTAIVPLPFLGHESQVWVSIYTARRAYQRLQDAFNNLGLNKALPLPFLEHESQVWVLVSASTILPKNKQTSASTSFVITKEVRGSLFKGKNDLCPMYAARLLQQVEPSYIRHRRYLLLERRFI